MMRSRRETVCLRIVLSIYLAVAIVIAAFASDTFSLFSYFAEEWARTVSRILRAGSLPALTLDFGVWAGLLGLSVASLLLAEQFLSHAFSRGWRLPSRWLWRSAQVHSALVFVWLLLLFIEEGRHMTYKDVLRVVVPVCVIAAIKLNCATLVLGEKRELPPADDVLPVGR